MTSEIDADFLLNLFLFYRMSGNLCSPTGWQCKLESAVGKIAKLKILCWNAWSWKVQLEKLRSWKFYAGMPEVGKLLFMLDRIDRNWNVSNEVLTNQTFSNFDPKFPTSFRTFQHKTYRLLDLFNYVSELHVSRLT